MRQAFMMVLGATWSVTLGALAAPDAVGPTASATPAPAALAVQQSAKPANRGAQAQSAGAAPAANTPAIGPEEHARLLRLAVQHLQGIDPVALQEAIGNLQELGGRAAAEALVTRLRMGLPPQLTELALDTLGVLNQPIAAPVLSELTLHRRWQIREKAVSALGALKVRSTVSVLLFALDDPSPEVRTAAALALGQIGDPRALGALTSALDRKVEGALVALAQLVATKQVDLVWSHAKTDLKAGEPALWALVSRSNLPAVTRLQVIRNLRELNSPEAQNVLALWQTNLRQGLGDRRLLSALENPGAKP